MQDPFFQDALQVAWNSDSAESFWSHFLGTARLADSIADAGGTINTDNRNFLEFQFARNLAFHGGFGPEQVRKASALLGTHLPPLSSEDLRSLDLERMTLEAYYVSGRRSASQDIPSALSLELQGKMRAFRAWIQGDIETARMAWRGSPKGFTETLMMAEVWADDGDSRAAPLIQKLADVRPVESKAFEARLTARQGDMLTAASYLIEALTRYRTDPWAMDEPMKRALDLAIEVRKHAGSKDISTSLFEALRQPFNLWAINRQRITALVTISMNLDAEFQVIAIEQFGANFPWRREFLEARLRSFEATGHSMARQAKKDLEEYMTQTDRKFSEHFIESAQ